MSTMIKISHFTTALKLPPALAARLSDSELVAFDFDGVVADTERHQMIAFTDLLNQKTGAAHDFKAIAKLMLGKPERVILTEFKQDYGLVGDLEELVNERGEIYRQSIVGNAELKPNPLVLESLDIAAKNDIPCIILSNGRSALINHFNNHWGISKKFDEVHAIDTRDIADKTDFLLDYAQRRNIDVSRVMMFEDAVGTLEKMAAKGIGGGVYVRHEFNRPDFVPSNGTAIDIHQTPGHA